MEVVDKRIDELIEYKDNPRNNDAAVDAIANSIQEFGFKVPLVVDENNVIVAGHTRVKAARKLGMETVPCVVASDLTPEQVRAFRIADNKTAEQSDWNMLKLAKELADIDIDFDAFGFSDTELENLTALGEDFFSTPDYTGVDKEFTAPNVAAPNLAPVEARSEVVSGDIEAASAKMASRFTQTAKAHKTIACPYCGEEFQID